MQCSFKILFSINFYILIIPTNLRINDDHKQRLDHKDHIKNWNADTLAYPQTESSFNQSEFYPHRVIGVADVN